MLLVKLLEAFGVAGACVGGLRGAVEVKLLNDGVLLGLLSLLLPLLLRRVAQRCYLIA